MDALDSVNELETNLDQSKESMYKLSYVIRVAADTLEELKRRCDEVKDFYDDLNVKLVRPFGDMLGLHGEFIPSSKRYINDYIQYVTSDFRRTWLSVQHSSLGKRTVSISAITLIQERTSILNLALQHRA